MTIPEIKAKLASIEKNNALPEKQKEMLLAKYKKMLSDAGGDEKPAAKPEPAKKEEKPAAKKAAPKKAAAKKAAPKKAAPKKAEPKAKTEEKKSALDEYDCDTLVAKAKERKKKAKARALEMKNAPKKTPATKNKEAVKHVAEKIEKNVEKRIEKGNVNISEIEKIITGYKDAIAKLEAILAKAKKAGKFEDGGTAESMEAMIAEARQIKDGHCGCSDKKKSEPKVVRGFADDDAYEYGDGGSVATQMGVDRKTNVYKSQKVAGKWVFDITYADEINGQKVWRKYANYVSEYFKSKKDAEAELEKVLAKNKFADGGLTANGINIGDKVQVESVNDNTSERYKAGDTFNVKMIVDVGSDNALYVGEDIKYMFHPQDVKVISKGKSQYASGGDVFADNDSNDHRPKRPYNYDVVDFHTEGEMEDIISTELEKWDVIHSLLYFDKVKGITYYGGEDEDNKTSLSFYKNGNLMFTIEGNYSEKDHKHIVKFSGDYKGADATFNYHPYGSFGDINSVDFAQEFINGWKKWNSPSGTYGSGGNVADKDYSALKGGERNSRKFANVEMKGGKTYHRRNANQYGKVKGGKTYTEYRENRSDSKRFL
jgi:hypothetical protein